MKKFVRNKSKVGIWTRIKNIFNNSPWHAAFTYPIIYVIFFISLLFIPYESNIGLIFIFILLAPLWVFLGIFISKKKTPFVLSLFTGLIIVPIFIAIYVAQDFTGSAKTSATKTIHAQNVRDISRELEKCSLGDATAMNGLLSCSKYSAETVIVAILKNIQDKNPYNTTYNAVRSSSSNTNDDDVGYISLSSSGSNIIIKSCNKTPCKKEENRKQSTVSIN